MIKFFRQKNNGFTLVETLIAISIFSVSITALLIILAQGISDTGYVKKKIIAGYLAQEGIEYLRNMRDSYVLYTDPINGNNHSWDEFKTIITACTNGALCGFDDSVPDFFNSIFPCSENAAGCSLYLDNGVYNTNNAGVFSGFTRTIKSEPINSNEIRIISTVIWEQGSGTYDIVLSENLFNWVE